MLSLGIDLSEEKMDLTLLRDSFRGPRLKAKARFYLPQGETTVAERRQYCAQKLRQFVIENSAQSAEVVVGLPRRHFLMRNVSIPSVRSEDVNRIMRYEADRHIPFDVTQVYFDTVCPENGRSAGAMEILFVAIRKNTMDELLEPVHAAGLKISAVDVSSFASAVAYLDRAGKDGTQTAFVEIGEATVILSLLCGGRLRSSRAFPLARILGAAGEGPDAADSLASAIVDELDTLAHSAAMEPGEKTFSHLVVTGPGASNPELVSGLERRLELEALLYAPLGQRTELSAEEAADMSRATSLALRGLSASMGGLNFLPEETRTVRKDYGPHLAAGLVALVVLQLGVLYAHGLYVKGLRVTALEAQKAQVMPQVDSIAELETEIAGLQAQVDELKSVDEPIVPRMLMLAELTKHLPQEAYLEYLNLKGEAMRIRVHSDGGLQIGPRLGQSPYVIDPKQTDQRNETITIDATIGFPTKDAGGAPESDEGPN